MHNKKLIIFTFLPAVLSLFFVSCDLEYVPSDNKFFNYDLQGTWVNNDPSSRYSGTLVITYNTITITGYGENQTPVFGGNDAERPFRSFTKRVALSGYSKDGRIFIKDSGLFQEGIPYTTYWGNYSMSQFLRFTFGGRTEILEKK